jgi:hypothetical protein
MGDPHKGDDQKFSRGVISTQLSQLKCLDTFSKKENNQIKCHIACSIFLTKINNENNEKPIFFHYIFTTSYFSNATSNYCLFVFFPFFPFFFFFLFFFF